jgi:signal peptide peptidase SppA
MEHLNNPVYSWAGDWRTLANTIAAVTQHIVSNSRIESAGPKRKGYQSIGGVGLISLRGPMMTGVSPEIEDWFGVTDTQRLARTVERAADDSAIDSICICVNSPGGSVEGLTTLADAVKYAASKKHVVGAVNGMAASAAYYAIAGAQTIYAGRMDLVGSIGTRLTVYDYSEAFADAGIKPVVIDTGEYKSMGEPGTEITDAHKAEFQRLVDGYFADFRRVVQYGRGMTDAGFEMVSDGRLFFAEDARGLGLVDGVSKVSDVITQMQTAIAARRRIAQL